MKLENLKKAQELMAQIDAIETHLECIDGGKDPQEIEMRFGERDFIRIHEAKDLRALAQSYRTILHNRRRSLRREIEGL